MAGSSDIFNKVRDATDIVDVISEHVALKRAGKEFVGLCPFHEDRRPSMHVVPQKQIFWCFVCQTGGDVFKFVTLYHKMTNGEALRFLAQKKGITLPELPGRGPGGGGRSQDSAQREQVAGINEWACGMFEKLLHLEAGREGLAYLRSRGLTEATLQQFRLGMAPDKWTALVDAARGRYSGEQLEAAGLVKSRADGSPYDLFRNRVIFPIVDATDRVIAFGGRVLQERRDPEGNLVEGKYLNSPETRLFAKSEALYGLNHAKKAIIKSNQAVIVEGYMDVIACHQAGISNVVATLGTAMTPQHANILRRFCQNIVLVFDSDDAGYRAADRAMELFVRLPLDIKIASVPDGKDPCDFCMSHGGEAFRQVVAEATDAMTYQWRRMQKVYQGNDSLSAQHLAVTNFVNFAAAAMEGQEMDAIRRGLLIGKISDLLGLSDDEVKDLLHKQRRPASAAPAASEGTPPVAVPAAPSLLGAESVAARVLGALLSAPNAYTGVHEAMTLELFAPDGLGPLAGKVMEYLENATTLGDCSLADFLSVLGESPLVMQAITVQQQVEGLGAELQDPAMRDQLYEREAREGLRLLAEIRRPAAPLATAADPASLLKLQEQSKARMAQGSNALPRNPYFKR